MKNIYKVFLVVVVFNVWDGGTTGTLVVPTFQEGTTILSPLRRWGSNPGRWHGEPKVQPLGHTGSRCRMEPDLRPLTLPYYKVTRDDKVYFTN